MARGKDAARAAHRRELASQGEVAKLRTQLAEERTAHHVEVEAMKAEIVKLRADARRKAAGLAESAIDASRAEARRAREDTLFLVDTNKSVLWKQKDVLIREACRYISMTTGTDPINAFCVVWTWVTNEDLPDGITSLPMDLAMNWGISDDGWVALMLRRNLSAIRMARNSARTRRRHGHSREPVAITLDHAEELGGDPGAMDDYGQRVRDGYQVHPGYKRWRGWYKAVTDEDLELLAMAGSES